MNLKVEKLKTKRVPVNLFDRHFVYNHLDVHELEMKLIRNKYRDALVQEW